MNEYLLLGLIFLILLIPFLIKGYYRYKENKARKEFEKRQERYRRMI